MKAFGAIAAAALLAGALAPAASGEETASQEPKQESRAKFAKVVFFPFREAVVSSTVAANVKEYLIKEGERFSSGNTIARLDSRQYQQANLKAKAVLAEAKASMVFCERNAKRAEDLFARSAIGLQELEQCRLDRDSAEAKSQCAEAALRLSELDLEACELKAPFDGRLTKRIAKANEFVNAGQPLMEIIDDSSLLADMHLPSSMRDSLKIGDELEFKVDEKGLLRKGRVHEISGRIDYESRTFEVKALIDNKDRALSAGMSGSLISGGL